jgi:SAM-dependent methyltransferase
MAESGLISKPMAVPSSVTQNRQADDFYAQTLAWLLQRGVLRKEMKVLVACGGKLDRDVLFESGFRNVTISNLDSQMKPDEFAPFRACVQDVEALSFPEQEFDFAIVHNGLHHCYSPHRGLLEIYRVSRCGVLVFEPRDSLLSRWGARLGFGQQYETAAVAANRCVAGGTGDTPIPNYVYRWTEREIEKTIRSYCPWGNPGFLYRCALRVPWGRLEGMNSRAFFLLVRFFLPLLRLFFLCFPGQANGFAFIVIKPRMPQDLYPWLTMQDGHLAVNKDWMQKEYHYHKT